MADALLAAGRTRNPNSMARRHFLLGAALLAVAVPRIGLAQEGQPSQEPPAKKPVFIFLQSAKSVTYDNGKLTLKGVSATTIYFADRPERVTGHMSTRAFIPFWKEGKETFLADPPHATLSVLGQGDGEDVVVELRDPVLKGDELSYGATVLQGEIPAKGGVASLFIDIIGMPAAAMPNAGAEQRMWRRRGYY
jgi:hypothetical protein